jgi:hypothetical protein
MTKPFELIVEEPEIISTAQVHQLVWERIPSGLKTGEEAIFVLRYKGRNSANLLPDAKLFLPPVPPGHILESVRLADDERPAGIALKLRLIPLEAVPFVLAKRQFSHGDNIFEIPALRITVTASEKKPAQNVTTAQNVTRTPNITTVEITTFPSLIPAIQNHSGLYEKHSAECYSIYTQAKDSWDKGHYALALAILRKNERDHAAGAFFAVIRREAEKAIGLSGTKDEEKGSFMPFWREKRRSAVLVRETIIRRIPDYSGEEIARFNEGHPVLLEGKPRSHRNQVWHQITAHDNNGISGWVSENDIIIY